MDRVVFFFLIAATLLAVSLGSAVISGEVNDGFVNPISGGKTHISEKFKSKLGEDKSRKRTIVTIAYESPMGSKGYTSTLANMILVM